MGATDFYAYGTGKTAREAFRAAQDEALHEYGHNGYTGTIAEKSEYVSVQVPEGKDPMQHAQDLVDADDRRTCDKYGPCGCIKVGEGRYLFFGFARE